MTFATSSTGFRFFSGHYQDLALPKDPGLLVARVASRIDRKDMLLDTLQRELKLPDYFGANWDALEECLRDFSWLTDYRGVMLVHAGLPFHAGNRSREVYLQILQDTIKYWANESLLTFSVLFPERDRHAITRLLKNKQCEPGP